MFLAADSISSPVGRAGMIGGLVCEGEKPGFGGGVCGAGDRPRDRGE